MTEPTRCFLIPPWTIIFPQAIWLLSIFEFIYFGFKWHSTSHFVMATVSFFIVVGIYMHWRVAFWLSSIGFAAATGGNFARITAAESVPNVLLIAQTVSIGAILLQQTKSSLGWFGFEKVRHIRLSYWGFSVLICIIAEFWLYRLLPKTI